MILSYFNILAIALVYNLFTNMTEDIHLDTLVDQIKWMCLLFKKCGAQIEAKGEYFMLLINNIFVYLGMCRPPCQKNLILINILYLLNNYFSY